MNHTRRHDGHAPTRSSIRSALVASTILCLTGSFGCAKVATGPADPPAGQSKREMTRDERMAWWREARFGMFIHWGLYAIPAGQWNGKKVRGIGEWIMNNAHNPGR